MPDEFARDQSRLMTESDLYAKLPLYLVISADGDIIEPMRSQNVEGEDVGVSVFTELLLATKALASWSRVKANVQRFDTQDEFRAMLWIVTQYSGPKWIALDPRTDDPIAAQWMQIEALLKNKEFESEGGQ